MSLRHETSAANARIDPRGPRFGAVLTSVVLAAALLLGGTAGLLLLALQAVVFAVGVGLGPAAHPYGWVFRTFVRPRLAPPAELEDSEPPRFAQGVGLAFALVGLAGGVAGSAVVFSVATGFALVAALLNAAFGLCLGCELYLLGRRLRGATGADA